MNRHPRIMILDEEFNKVNHRYFKEIERLIPLDSIVTVDPKNISDEIICKVEIIYGNPHVDLIKKADKLKWLHLGSAGADRYTDKSIYANDDITLTNSSGVYGMPIAEHVFSLILAYNRGLFNHFDNQRAKKWNPIWPVRDFAGSTLGIIGLGDIGIEVAKRAKSWGSRVMAVKRKPENKPEYIDELYGTDELYKVTGECDYIVSALPHTKDTQGIINRDILRNMKPHAFIVNVGRGSAIVQDDLIEALNNKWIGGAGLDVTTPEPLPAESPLWDMPNVIITSHSSGFSTSNTDRNYKIFMDNLKLYLNKQPLKNQVRFNVGY